MHEGGESKIHSNSIKKGKAFSRRVKATCRTQTVTGFLAAVSSALLRPQSRYKVVTSVMDFSLYGVQTMTGLNYLVLHFQHRDNG